MKSLMVISFLVASCSAGPSSSNNIGYYEDDKPYRGTREFNREYVRPFWQCVFQNMNIKCK